MATTINSVSPSLLATMNPGKSTSTTSSNPTSAASALSGNTSAASLQNNFMTMLITQLKNQDPLNPMDNSQVTSQMAQLSTVSGIGQLNSTMSSLMSNFQSTQTLQASNLINHTVVVPGSSITLASGAAQFGVKLDAAASNVQAVIKNSAGNTVATMSLGSMPAGVSAIPWNGLTDSGTTAPDGQYSFSIAATNGKAAVNSTALSVGTVTSVATSSAGAMLNIPDIGSVNISNVLQIL